MREKIHLTDYLKFIIPSLLGILILIVPFQDSSGSTTIFVAYLASRLTEMLGDTISLIAMVLVWISTVGSIVYKLVDSNRNSLVNMLFDTTPVWLILRILATVFITCTYFQVGPEMIISLDTGGLVLYDLIPTLFSIFLFAGLLLPLLTDFGLLEFVGVLLTDIMRPLFNVPGRSSVNAIASWVGDGTIGVAMTNRQWLTGHYTQREACTIATMFSAVSITFCLVILGTVGLDYVFIPFYIGITVIGLIVAMIVPRIPPLSKKPDVYIDGRKREDNQEGVPEGFTKISYGVHLATQVARDHFSIKRFLVHGIETVLDMWVVVIPSIMAFGTLGLIVAEYTPVFNWLGLPFLPILKILGVPYAVEVSQTIMVGFADMFIPSVIGASITGAGSEVARFIVAGISVVQILFLSETAGVILGTDLDLSLKDIFIIFIERTVVALPLVVLLAKIYVSLGIL